jgi:hypothetical protein
MEITTTQEISFKIVRRNSLYNKYIRWFLETYNEAGVQIASIGFKTEREARASAMIQPKQFPIGNKLISYSYHELS